MSTTVKHFPPRASLAAIGLRLRRLRLLEAIAATARVPQKTVKHTPAKKLYDAFLAIPSGAPGLSEIDTRLRADPVPQRSFGRRTCAEYSLVQDTLDASTPENVEQLRRVVTSLFREHSRRRPPRLLRLAPPPRPRHDGAALRPLCRALQVLRLLGRPAREASEPELAALAYARPYDQRAGAIEIKIKEDKQGVGITRRRKKRAAAQAMLMLPGTLAHNVLVWARDWLGAAELKLKQYGIVRLLRDVLCVSGFVETDERGEAEGVVLNRGSTLARLLAGGLRELLAEQSVTVSLGDLSG